MKDGSVICCKYLIHNTLVVQGLAQETCAMGLVFKSRNIFRSPNFLGISNIFVKVFVVVVENCLYIF